MSTLRVSLASTCLAALLVACGGEDRGRPEASPAPPPEEIDQCALGDGYEFLDMVDFEPMGTMRSARCNPEFTTEAGNVKCGFFFNFDTNHTPGSAIETCGFMPLCPPVTSEVNLTGQLIGEEFTEPRCGATGSALHYVGTNVASCYNKLGRNGWGSSIEVNFTQTMPNTADLSAWDGISFWARLGSGPSGLAFDLLAVDSAANGRDCNSSDTNVTCALLPGDPGFVPDAHKCDPFGMSVRLKPEWTFVMLPFDRMRQKGYGVPAALGRLDTTEMVRFQIYNYDGNWDFWIDDIRLFRTQRE